MMFDSDAAGLGLLAVLGGFIIVVLLIGLVFYLLAAFGLYTMAKRRGIELAWLSFIPYANFYILALLINKKLKIFSLDIPRPELVLPLAPIAASILGSIPVIGFLASIATAVLLIAAFYYLFKLYKGKDTAVLYTVVGFVLGFMLPIFIFITRNADPIYDDAV